MRFTQGETLQRRQELHHSRESPRYILALEKRPRYTTDSCVIVDESPLLEAVREVVELVKYVLRIKLLDRPVRHSILLGFQKPRIKTLIPHLRLWKDRRGQPS